MTSCWIITEGMIGTQNQCVALAEATGVTPVIKTVSLKQPWKFFTPWIRHFVPKALTSSSSELTAPWPDLIIASGRKAIAPSLWIKKQNQGRTKLVIVQSPVVKDTQFDLVIAPYHDQYNAPNALPITGALSLITPHKLSNAKQEWQHKLEALPAPRLAVLIGGNSRKHQFTMEIARHLVEQLRQLQSNYSLMITASRRTPQDIQDYLRKHLHGPKCFFWDGSGDNPYQGFLAWADALVVTEDSVSMISEAVSTGKPVYLLKMDSKSTRFDRFYQHLLEKNYARWFTGTIEPWDYTPPCDLENAAQAVKALLNQPASS